MSVIGIIPKVVNPWLTVFLYIYVYIIHMSYMYIYIYTHTYIYIYTCLQKNMATGVCIDDDDARLSSAGIGSGHGSKAIQMRDEAPIPRAKLISKKEKHSIFGLPICLFNWSLWLFKRSTIQFSVQQDWDPHTRCCQLCRSWFMFTHPGILHIVLSLP